MFIIKKQATYECPVRFFTPAPLGDYDEATGTFKGEGEYEKQAIRFLFRRLPQSRLEQIGREVKAAAAGEASAISDLSVAQEIIAGWSEVTDEDGKEVAFSIANRDELLESFPGLSTAVVEAFMKSITGVREGN